MCGIVVVCGASHQTSSVGHQDTWIGETIRRLVRWRRQGVRAGAGAHTLGGGGPGLRAQDRITQLVGIQAQPHPAPQPVLVAAALSGRGHRGGGGGGGGVGSVVVSHPGRGEDVLQEGIRVKIKVIGEL